MLVDVGSMNWWAVLVAAVLGHAIGAVWYAPPAFGKRRLAALGKSKDQLGDSVKPMVVQFFLALVVAAVLAAVVVRFGAVTWIEGAAIGFVLSVGLVSTSLLTAWMFGGFDMKLYRLQVGCEVAQFTAMGAILGAWR